MIEQTKTKPQESLEFKMKKQSQRFSFIPPKNFSEEGKWLLAVSSFEETNSVFQITDGNNSFSINIPGYWDSKSAEKTTNELNQIIELSSQKRIELRVKEVKKRVNQLKIADNE